MGGKERMLPENPDENIRHRRPALHALKFLVHCIHAFQSGTVDCYSQVRKSQTGKICIVKISVVLVTLKSNILLLLVTFSKK
jgi:uncharacterized membrane protein YwzB